MVTIAMTTPTVDPNVGEMIVGAVVVALFVISIETTEVTRAVRGVRPTVVVDTEAVVSRALVQTVNKKTPRPCARMYLC